MVDRITPATTDREMRLIAEDFDVDAAYLEFLRTVVADDLVRGLAEGHEGSIAQVRPRCRCRRRRSETEQSPAGSVVAGERPFDRFRRGTNQAGGHGLGLSIAVPPAECRGRCFRLRERPVDRSDLLRCRRAILARVLASIVHEFGRETVDSLRRCRDDRGSASNPFQLQV